MKGKETMFPKARIPYGTWGSSYFPAWQTSALAEVNIGQFAGEAMNKILGMRKIPKSALDILLLVQPFHGIGNFGMRHWWQVVSVIVFPVITSSKLVQQVYRQFC